MDLADIYKSENVAYGSSVLTSVTTNESEMHNNHAFPNQYWCGHKIIQDLHHSSSRTASAIATSFFNRALLKKDVATAIKTMCF